MKKSKWVLASAALLVLLAISVFIHRQQIMRLQAETSRAREQAAALEALENARLLRSQADAAELERGRQAQAELSRLRGEVSRLRRQLEEDKLVAAKRAAATKEATPAPPSEPPPSPVENYTASIRATLASRQMLITGGWNTGKGKRAFFLVEPEFGSANVSAGQVMLRARAVEMPESALSSLGWDGLKSEGKQSSTRTFLTSEQAEAVIKTLESTAGVDLLTAPQVLTLDGRQAQIKVESTKIIAGQSYDLGPLIDLVPRLSPDGTSVDLSVSTQLRLENAPLK